MYVSFIIAPVVTSFAPSRHSIVKYALVQSCQHHVEWTAFAGNVSGHTFLTAHCRAECGELHTSNGRASDMERSRHNIMEASSDVFTEMFLLLKDPANDLARQVATSEQTAEILMSSLEVCRREPIFG